MTQSGRGMRDRTGGQTEETQKQKRGKERVSGRKRRALELGEQVDWERGHESSEGEERRGEQEKAHVQNQALPKFQK